jgi:KUP system potassium uptake protein
MLMYKSKTPLIALIIGALGVVFGDIGTSPLYVMKVIFGKHGRQLPVNELTVHGILSLVIWTIIIVVCIKYISFVMRIDNRGEGGIMALIARLKSGPLSARKKAVLIFLGLIGAALFYGDSALTPAVSVLSAVEGVKIAAPALTPYIIPLTLIILVGLFWIQKYGTAVIGKFFGPVMLVWFLLLAAGGLGQIILQPTILHALSPLSALHFVSAMPLVAFLAMSAVILAITGAEALFADMGHFGRPPLARAWFFVVFPALLLCYMGQGALILANPDTAADPFFLLFPAGLHLPVLIIAAAATLIASQSVISGAFSLTRQAVQLGFLPRLTIRHTSDHETGQVYVPFVNLLLCLAVMLCVIVFGSSVKLAGAYGVAVSGALAVDTVLFFAIMRTVWPMPRLTATTLALLIGSLELVLLTASSTKIPQGGWLPLLIAAGVLLIIDTWRKGGYIIGHERHNLEGSLQHFITRLHTHKFGRVARLPGQAVFIGHHPGQAPLALRATVENLHELHKKVAVVYVTIADSAHVPEEERAEVNDLKYTDGISEVTLTFGFHDSVNIPRTLESLRHVSPELNFDPYKASYFISLTEVVRTKRENMSGWRKALYEIMERNSISTSNYYKLPIEHTAEMRALVKL